MYFWDLSDLTGGKGQVAICRISAVIFAERQMNWNSSRFVLFHVVRYIYVYIWYMERNSQNDILAT